MKRLLLFLLLTITTAVRAQDIETSQYMGNIEAGDSRLADFDWQNTTGETVYILRADVPENCTMKLSAKEVKSGETGVIRIKYNPTRKGPFIQKIPVYFSSKPEPVVLTISGNVKYLDPQEDVVCPNFNMTQDEKEVRQPFVVYVVDKQTQQPISGATVNYDPAPALRHNFFTGSDGSTRTVVPIGIYHLEGTAKGYTRDTQDIYISKTLATTTLYLDRLPDNPIIQPRDTLVASTERHPDPIQEKPGKLPMAQFGPNNVVFLIDVSSSMAYPNKLPLLKIAMKNLLSSMRSIDRISIVTYAGNTDVVLESTPADKKEKIADRIDGLKSGGSTEGGKGIREAYRVAEKNFIPGGNLFFFVRRCRFQYYIRITRSSWQPTAISTSINRMMSSSASSRKVRRKAFHSQWLDLAINRAPLRKCRKSRQQARAAICT
jgi:hypothetical protein